MVQTPVGVRCRSCANMRRLPQFDVGPTLLARAVPAGLVTSIVAWFLVSAVPFLSVFLSILVGVAVGEVMSRLSRRRTSLPLEALAVLDVVVGLAVVVTVSGSLSNALLGSGVLSRELVQYVLPAAIASFVAVLKLR
jgi:hypothetical protein